MLLNNLIDECTISSEKNLCESIFILIGLEEINTAVYIYVGKNLIERLEIEFKRLGVHKTCDFCF
jgi:hypothetical protein